jgi:TonB family protein
MKVLTRTAATLASVLLCACAARAQDADTWAEFTPQGEEFAVRLPQFPASQSEAVEAGELKVSGRRYSAVGHDQSVYLVWSLEDNGGALERLAREDYVSERFRGEALYLDLLAEVAYELIASPALEEGWPRGEEVEEEFKKARFFGLAYRREFELEGRPAREYAFNWRNAAGPVIVCADGPRVYVVAALSRHDAAPQPKQFVESFKLKTAAPARQASRETSRADATRQPAPSPPDYEVNFRQAEVARKAVITAKPEPGFTESARKFNVSGTVRLSAVLNRTGEVTDVAVLAGLPHGLTTKSVEAAKKMKFEPAQKDGRAVSQYITLEYNFNVY